MPKEQGDFNQHFDRAIMQTSLQLIVNHQVHDANVGLLRQFIQDRPQLAFLNALLMPSRYGELEWTDTQRDNFFKKSAVLQLSMLFDVRKVPNRSLLYPLYEAFRSQGKIPNDPIIESPIRFALEADLATLMETETQAVTLSDETSKTMFLRLGLESTADFGDSMQDHIADFLRDRFADNPQETTELIGRFNRAFTFARQCYSHTDKPERKTGEPYYHHPTRVLWYLLTYLERRGELPTDPNELLELIETTLLHDVEEDLGEKKNERRTNKHRAFMRPRLAVPPRESIQGQIERDLTDSYLPYGLDDWEMVLVDPQDQEVATHPLQRSQRTTLRALTARDSQTYLHQSMKEDPTGKAALIKMFDRLDNLLTYPPNTNWLKLMSKIIESFTSMGLVTLHARSAHKTGEKVRDVFGCITNGSFAELLPINVIAFGMFLQSAAHLHRSFQKQQAEYYNAGLGKRKNLRNWQNYEQLRRIQTGYGGIMLEDLPKHLNFSTMYTDYDARCHQSDRDAMQTLPAYRYLFSYADIHSYLQRVESTCIAAQPIILNHTGCPEILFTRKGVRRSH